jgi:hypothetical protein
MDQAKRDGLVLPRRTFLIGATFFFGCFSAFAVWATLALSDLGHYHGYVYLGRGTLGKHWSWYSWIEAPPKTTRITANACISLDLREPSSPYSVNESESRECGAISERHPLAQSISGGDANANERTALVLVFSRGARKLFLDLGTKGHKEVALRQISRGKANEIGIRPVSYWAYGFRGRFCLRRFISYNRLGRVLSDSGRMRCRTD